MLFLKRTPSRVQALICVAVLLGAAALCHPVAEIGIYDDWSYVRTAQLLAQTGHVYYNGWATAMLGWQLYPAAACFRLFGFSFTLARLTTLSVAALTVYLVHRCCTRCGCRPWNATWATLTLVLSPLFLPLAITFMSDVYGLFAIVACLYCCVRATEVRTPEAVVWLAAAAAVNVVGGTARQIAWLGALVMVPSTVWILRRERRVVMAGLVCWVVGAVSIFAFMRWFAHQPYAVPEIFPDASVSGPVLARGGINMVRLGLELGMLSLPMLVGFYPALAASRGRVTLVAATGLVLAGAALVLHRSIHHLGQVLVPTLLDGGNYVGAQGLLTAWPEHGSRPTLLPDSLRLCLTLAVLLGILAVLFTEKDKAAAAQLEEQCPGLAWDAVLILTLPFTVAYLLLLTPRAAFFHPYDRYCLPLMVLAGILLIRMYQQGVRERLPLGTVLLVLVVGAYSIATTHDAFAMYRGTQQAIREVQSAGVPARAVDAGWEYSGWTQVTQDRFVHDLRLHIQEPHRGQGGPDTRPCPFDLQYLFPAVEPRYSLSFSPDACGGPAPFRSLSFKTWLPWTTQTIYVVRNAPRPMQ